MHVKLVHVIIFRQSFNPYCERLYLSGIWGQSDVGRQKYSETPIFPVVMFPHTSCSGCQIWEFNQKERRSHKALSAQIKQSNPSHLHHRIHYNLQLFVGCGISNIGHWKCFWCQCVKLDHHMRTCNTVASRSSTCRSSFTKVEWGKWSWVVFKEGAMSELWRHWSSNALSCRRVDCELRSRFCKHLWCHPPL